MPQKKKPGSSPTLRARELGQRLRELRKNAGLPAEVVADRLCCSMAKVSYLESGFRPATIRDIRDLSVLYGLGEEEREYLMTLARQAREKGWWDAYGQVPYAKYIGYEAEAKSLRSFEPLFIPGLLQTDAYAMAVIRSGEAELTAEEIDQRAQVRSKRQELLTRKSPIHLRTVIDEAVVRRLVGGRDVMREQLQHLANAMSWKHVELQVIPFTSGAHAGMVGQFAILELADSEMDDVGYVDTMAGNLYVEKAPEVERLADTFEKLAASALTPAESAALIERVIKEY